MHTYSPDLLLPYYHPSTEWLSTDSAALFQHNLTVQPESWFYRYNTVTYTFNSNGYRCAEWNQIDWYSSTVLMGCSIAMGVGLTDSETITAYWENGVNLAQPGISLGHIHYNSLRLIDQRIRPKKVNIIIPQHSRTVYWSQRDWVDLTAHDFDQRGSALNPAVQDFYRGYIAFDTHVEIQAELTARSIKALWNSVGVDCALYSLTPVNYAQLLPAAKDPARDIDPVTGAHPGRLTVAGWSRFIWEN